MEWAHFEDGTVRVKSDAGDAYVHTDRSILRFDLPGDGARFTTTVPCKRQAMRRMRATL